MSSRDSFSRQADIESDIEDFAPAPRKQANVNQGWQSQVQVWHCQLAVALVQTSFVVGSVYLKRSFQQLHDGHFHPIMFALAREAVAGPILCAIAYITTGAWPRRGDLLQICALGLCLFLNQLFYIMGIDMSGVVVATCMQPSIPVITAMLGVMLGLESGSVQKFAGIILSVAGSICMVMGGLLKGGSTHSAEAGNQMLMGNLCLLANTFSMAVYYLLAKALVQKYNPVCVAAWAYITAAVLMGSTALVTVDHSEWTLPAAMIAPLVYWIVVASVLGYYLLTAATRYLPASQVAAFQCLQPFMGTVLAFFVLGELPTIWDLGAIGVVAGLVLVVREPKESGGSGGGGKGWEGSPGNMATPPKGSGALKRLRTQTLPFGKLDK